MRLRGLTFKTISNRFGIHPSTVAYTCSKYDVKPKKMTAERRKDFIELSLKLGDFSAPKKVKKKIQDSEDLYMDGEKISQGKLYAEYLQDEKARKSKKKQRGTLYL